MKITLINKHTGNPYPSITIGDRTFYAIEAGQPIRVRVDSFHGQREVTLMVDGRDVLTNRDGELTAPGMVCDDAYECNGFRVDANTEREFIAAPVGLGLTTSEKNGSASLAGVIAAAAWAGHSDRPRASAPRRAEHYGGVLLGGTSPLRGVTSHAAGPHLSTANLSDGGLEALSFSIDRTVGGSIGVMAGDAVHSPTTSIKWNRSHASPETAVVEYDTFANLKSRNILVPLINQNWPPRRTAFANPSTL